MLYLRSILFCICCFTTLNAYGRTAGPGGKNSYTIDASIKTRLAQKIKSFNGVTMSAMDFRIYENDSLIADTYTAGKTISECMVMASLAGDSISITGFLGMFAGFGYQIDLTKNTCVVTHFAKSDAETYKLHKGDSLTFGVYVPCTAYRLTLAKKPAFKKGEVLEGIVELTSDEYYEVANGKETRYKMQMTGYFKIDPLAGLRF